MSEARAGEVRWAIEKICDDDIESAEHAERNIMRLGDTSMEKRRNGFLKL